MQKAAGEWPLAGRRRQKLRIAAILTVKDEVELIERTIAHLRAIGVDLIVACDVSSTDGTQDILERYRSEDFWIVRLSDTAENLVAPIMEVIRRVEQAGIDWMIGLDADEYWLPVSGCLKDCAALANSDVLSVDRFNVPLVAHSGLAMPDRLDPAGYEQLLMIVEPISDFRNHLRDNPETPWSRGVPARKVMARPAWIKEINEAMHKILAIDETTVRRSRARDIIIAHVPFSSRDRFRRKIANIRKSFGIYGTQIPDGVAWHWRRWIEVTDQDGVDREFDRNTFDPAMVTELRAQGVVRSAAEVIRQRIAVDAPLT